MVNSWMCNQLFCSCNIEICIFHWLSMDARTVCMATFNNFSWGRGVYIFT
ncbi:MAG: hypothetical protein VX397_04065 [Pseudomonadota bacterium]|nr:hypothetical protein [Pseudomonadota bacterium]